MSIDRVVPFRVPRLIARPSTRHHHPMQRTRLLGTASDHRHHREPSPSLLHLRIPPWHRARLCVAPQSVYSRSSLPGRLRAESVGRRAPPPPPPTAACQKKLDAFCQNKTEPAMKPCYATKPGTPGYPDYLPLVARDSFGCAEEPPKPWPHGLPQGATQCRHNGCVYYACVLSWCDIIMMTGPCQKALARPGWRCYSALALSPDKSEWSNKAKHPNAYCSEPGSALEAIAKAC